MFNLKTAENTASDAQQIELILKCIVTRSPCATSLNCKFYFIAYPISIRTLSGAPVMVGGLAFNISNLNQLRMFA